MAKLRHIAIQVPDLEKAAAFYEGVFGLKHLKKVEAPIGNAISLSDGVMNLTLLHFPEGAKGGKRGPDWAGLHHFGFVVENERATEERIKSYGGEFYGIAQLPRRRR
jgi:catechol 2,3-dioxygenase-like lactoylglutathione lyase family enzyme